VALGGQRQPSYTATYMAPHTGPTLAHTYRIRVCAALGFTVEETALQSCKLSEREPSSGHTQRGRVAQLAKIMARPAYT